MLNERTSDGKLAARQKKDRGKIPGIKVHCVVWKKRRYRLRHHVEGKARDDSRQVDCTGLCMPCLRAGFHPELQCQEGTDVIKFLFAKKHSGLDWKMQGTEVRRSGGRQLQIWGQQGDSASQDGEQRTAWHQGCGTAPRLPCRPQKTAHLPSRSFWPGSLKKQWWMSPLVCRGPEKCRPSLPSSGTAFVAELALS